MTKCPRKKFRRQKEVTTEVKPPKRLTALQESSYQDILPFATLARVIRELSSDLLLPEMWFTRKAIQAFRSGTEAYLLEIFEKAKFACRHAGHCTLQPKDIRVVRRILDHDVTMGCTDMAMEGWQRDILKYKAKRITYKQAKTKEATRRAKLRKLARLHHEAYHHQGRY